MRLSLRRGFAVGGLLRGLRRRVLLARVCALSLVYNDHLSWSYTFDTAMEPLFWLVDLFARVVGPAFVVCVVCLNVAVVAVAHFIGLPHYWRRSPPLAVFLVIVGYYILINIVFHYVRALQLGPGTPPTDVRQAASVCKKCVAPKPARAHHCSVCDRCVLKMDHHCPWINSCVGHWNHRHFFLYMVFTVLGCIFLMAFGFEILWQDLFGDEGENEQQFSLLSRRSLIRFEAIITTGCFVVLGYLSIWHGNLITRGETSIEAHINRAERKRLGKTYRNPYDFSPWRNWCLFLGVIDGRSWLSVVLPSVHLPRGDGLYWDSVYNCNVKWNSRD